MAVHSAAVEVTLLHVKSGGADDDDQEDALASILASLRKSTVCCEARPYLSALKMESASPVNQQAWGNVEDGILKYVMMKDRYLALSSVLLKSRAFHETYPPPRAAAAKPIVELPRTEHKKPFIPIHQNPPPTLDDEENLYPLSISHQFPFAGMARLVVPDETQNNNNLLLAGFDIVVFDEINSKLYSTVQDFVDVFRDCFAPSEWAAMNDTRRCPDEGSQLRELYLRWAVKEAYTKALGVGLGFDFSSFATLFDNLGDQTSLWRWISAAAAANAQSFLMATATVRQVSSAIASSDKNARPHQENWRFFFLPLCDTLSGSGCAQKMKGCGCVCVGPLASNDSDTDRANFDITVQIQWTTISELITWHTFRPDVD